MTSRKAEALVDGFNFRIIEDGALNSVPPAYAFRPFAWGNADLEDARIREVFAHLQQELARLHIIPQGFQLYDVHSYKDYLNTKDRLKRFELAGTTDFVIGPAGYRPNASQLGIAVMFEIKSRTIMQREGVNSFDPQAEGELIASRVRSRQPNVLVIVTDLATTARAYSLDYDAVRQRRSIHEQNMSLPDMCDVVCNFLNNVAEPDILFDVTDRKDQHLPMDLSAIDFFATALQHDEMMERWNEMLLDAKDQEERVEIFAEIFRAHDMPVPKLLRPLKEPFKEEYSSMYC